MPLAAEAQTEWQDPRQTDSHRELPGSPIRSYDSRELALSEDDAHSLYIQNLDGEWRVKTYASATELDSLLTLPSVDVSSWDKTVVPEKTGNGAWAAVYRTEFKLPFKWIDREIFVRCDAVSRAYYVFVNGHPVGYHEDSKTPAYFDVTKYVVDGRNTLALIAYAHPISTTLENRSETKGTRIEGSVRVTAQPKVRIRDYVVDTQWDPQGNGLFSFGAIVKSHLLNPKQVTVHYELLAPDSTVVSQGTRDARFHLREEDTVRFFANLPDIESWSHESPKLYTVALRLQHEGRFTEYTKVRIGFRDVAFDCSGMRINGRPVELRAVDYDAPQDEAAWRRDMASFRKKGVNCLRVNRWPLPDSFYSLADSYGLYICDRANIDTRLSGESLQKEGTPANDTLWTAAMIDRVKNMYYASQNHPSVVMFSLGGQAGRGYGMYEAFLALKAIEKNRPVIYEGAGAEWNTDIVIGKPEGRHPSDDRYTLVFGSPDSFAAEVPSAAPVIEPAEGVGQVTVRNRFGIANLKNFATGYTIRAGAKRIVASGTIPTDIAPGEQATLSVPLDGVKPGKYTLSVWIAHKDATPFAAEGERLAETEFPLIVPKTGK